LQSYEKTKETQEKLQKKWIFKEKQPQSPFLYNRKVPLRQLQIATSPIA
jgi:hypothetical protein